MAAITYTYGYCMQPYPMLASLSNNIDRPFKLSSPQVLKC